MKKLDLLLNKTESFLEQLNMYFSERLDEKGKDKNKKPS